MNNNNKLVPQYRFPEFKDEGAWIKESIENIIHHENSTLSINKLNILSKGFKLFGADGLVGYIDSYKQEDDYIAIIKDGSGAGRLSYYPSYSSVVGTLTYLKIKDKKLNDLKFQYYNLHNIDFKNHIKGGGIPHIYYSDYKNDFIGNPSSITEQQKIAACLSNLDELIAAHEEKLKALEDHKKGLMQNLFPQEGETKPKYRFPEFKNDGDWVDINILEIATMKARIGWQNLRTDEHLNQGEYYLVTGTDFKNNRVDWENAKFVSYDRYIQDEHIILKEGDILITKDGSIGKVAYVNNINDRKSTLNNGIFRIRVNDNYKSEFIFHSFLSTRFKLFLEKLSGGSSIVHLYQKDFEKYLIQLPENNEEQQKIASVLSSVDELIVAQREKIEALKAHKKGLMQGLFPKIES